MIRIAATTAALAGVTGLVIGCSSAPDAGQDATSSDSLTGVTRGGAGIAPLPLPIPIVVCPGLPDVKNECVPNERGYNLAMPASVTSCPGIWLADLGMWWPATNATPSAPQDPAPSTGNRAGNEGTNVCQYEFTRAWKWMPMPYGRYAWSMNTAQISADELCKVRDNVPYTAITYILPAHDTGMAPPSVSPQGVPLPPIPIAGGNIVSCLHTSQSRGEKPIEPIGGCDVCIVRPGGGGGQY